MGWRLSAHSGSKVSEIHPASQTCFLPVLISGKMPKQLGDELSIYLFNTNASFFDLVKSDVFFLVLMKITVNLSASIISPHGRTGDQPCDLITCRIYGMKGKVNPGIFKANPSDFSQKYLDTEKVLITTVTHTEDMSTYFDFWDVAKEEEMQVPDQKSRSFQVVSTTGFSEAHAVLFLMNKKRG
ncbi:uncharacterized protein LOC114057791 isoform X1 [Empidonax traillii]|uniref:uncharacterized protein LOC114057791 isoform X1 n=1 Tax=Empidonax traillii TaxID=164674 RepID=UPI000FFD8548|nr:uncharacterized protein LOC114057791 isoform X1 [Empidonax traillii]